MTKETRNNEPRFIPCGDALEKMDWEMEEAADVRGEAGEDAFAGTNKEKPRR